MTAGPTYGVVPTGFNRKSFNTVLLEVEEQMITEFGPNVIQTPQSPFGQINGLFAYLVTQLWEYAEDVYQSYDVDQAEGVRLDGLATLRLMQRSFGESDQVFRQAITNQGRARVDIADLSRALLSLEGVTYSQVWIPGNADNAEQEIPPGYIAVAVIGGDDTEIAATMRYYVVPGISTYGNTPISATIDGYCRSMHILRPVEVPVKLKVYVLARRDEMGCPPPALLAIRDTLCTAINKLRNGDDVTYFRVRSAIESAYPNVEVAAFEGNRDDKWLGVQAPIQIAFQEIARVTCTDIVVEQAPDAYSNTSIIYPTVNPTQGSKTPGWTSSPKEGWSP